MNARVLRWIALCAAAETVGMTAAAFAARASEHWSTAPALSLIVAGGLVEGIALGSLQGLGLTAWLPRLSRGRFLVATVLVAGLGWAAASAPAALSTADDSEAPPMGLVLLGAAGLGLAMGALLGAVQAWAMRGSARHPWRWVGASTAAWPPTMAVIFAGATTAGASWPTLAVALWGTLTGAVAGTALGLVTAPFLASLDGPPLHNALVMTTVRSPRLHLFDDTLVVIGVRGRRTGRAFELPAQYVADEGTLVVLPGHADRKRWWRNLEQPADVTLWLHGGAHLGTGRVLHPDQEGYAEALATYRGRWPKVTVPADQPLVLITVRAPATAG